MGPILNGLIKLQSVENRLRAAKAKLARSRRSVIVQENQVRSLQSALEAKKEELQLTKVQSNRLELELKSRDEEVSKLRAALNTSKSQILDLMKAMETDEAECENIRKQIEEQKQQLEQTRKKAEAAAGEQEAEIKKIQAEWNELAKTIPAEPLKVFKRVAETYDGEAVAQVEEQEGRHGAYSCGGCFMGITAESVNLLMTRDEIIRCPNCTRILVLSSAQMQV
jgi:predicted  nucleic acid-binding Zn-ribbon protein